MTNIKKLTESDFTRIASDVNGNPRYYLSAYMAEESAARKLGAVKYRGKQYGAGWVFQTYSLRGVIEKLNGH
jgi:hypothetical protein